MRLSGGRFEIRDLKSANGTFVNGQRIDRAVLRDGDLVGIGRHDFRFVDGQLEEYVDTGLITFSARDLVVETDDGVRLVDGVNFSLDAQSLLAVVGPSGAGKSTLLSVLTGLRPATQGAVLYEGRDLYRDGASLRSRIGVVPQADLLHDGLTIRRSLGYTERLRLPPDVSAAERIARIDEVLAQLGLDHRVDSRIDHLSGGERKRVNVATELLTEPSLLLLDEPASGLDAGLERTLMLMLRDLADDGHTIVVVTHSLDSLHLCDHLLVLAPGGIPAYFGPPDGARDRFGGEELVDVFHQMSDGADDRQWRNERASATDDEPGLADGDADEPKFNASLAARSWFGQLAALSSRFARVLVSDRRNALLLVLQAPVLGLLMAIALPTAELSAPGVTEIRFVSTAGLVLFVVLLGATWLGANNAIREIARERALFERERAVGLSTSAYVLSKAIVLGAITAVQAFVLVPIALLATGRTRRRSAPRLADGRDHDRSSRCRDRVDEPGAARLVRGPHAGPGDDAVAHRADPAVRAVRGRGAARAHRQTGASRDELGLERPMGLCRNGGDGRPQRTAVVHQPAGRPAGRSMRLTRCLRSRPSRNPRPRTSGGHTKRRRG